MTEKSTLSLTKKYNKLLSQHKKELAKRQWAEEQILKISKVVQESDHVEELGDKTLQLFTSIIEGCCSTFYLLEQWSEDEEPFLRQVAAYASPQRDTTFSLGEGFVGQCALDKASLHIKKLPKEYLSIQSGTGKASPCSLFLTPLLHEDKVKGVLELASFHEITPEHISFITQTASSLAIKINSIESKNMVNELLLKAHKYGEDVERRNQELLEMKVKLEQKNEQVQESSRYKSEFLANMSHELRTPLNSLLLLSNKLAQNTNGNLNPQEVEYADVISGSGHDLLTLINDILDLSKIEAGKMTINPTPVSLKRVAMTLERLFTEVAAKKGLQFEVNIKNDNLPEIIQTDQLRIEQVLRNFLTNAFKFTPKGAINMTIESLENIDILRSTKLQKKGAIAFHVTDTGIGIDETKLSLVFESFQQSDGTTSRQYGGTGLGLSISRELAKLLGGEIHMHSALGKGSTFTLYIPAISADMNMQLVESPSLGEALDEDVDFLPDLGAPICPDDRENITATTPFTLVFEDTPILAKLIVDNLHHQGQLALVIATPQKALNIALNNKPTAIILNLNLENMAGQAAKIKLSGVPETAKIPTLLLSKLNDPLSLLGKSVTHQLSSSLTADDITPLLKNFQRLGTESLKNALIIGKDQGGFEVFKKQGIALIPCNDIDHALKKLSLFPNSFVVFDARENDLKDLQSLENSISPVLIIQDADLSPKEKNEVRRLTACIISNLKEGQDLIAEQIASFTKTFVSQPANTQEQEKKTPAAPRFQNSSPKTVLLVDDDMRNIFALSALLEDQGLTVIEATSGNSALDVLGINSKIDMVLMDIMMPGLDGNTVMKRIRSVESNNYIPVIALSAKAMKEDQRKALDSGADEFIAKPIDFDQLLSIMDLWFKKQKYAS